MEAYLEARRTGALKNRLVMMYLSSYLHDLIHMGMRPTLGDDFLSFGPVKLYADGALTGKTAAFSCAYCTDPDNRGYLYHPPEELTQLIVAAHEFGLQTGTHAQGDVGIECVLQARETAYKVLRRDNVRHRIEYCNIPLPGQPARIQDLELWLITQPRYLQETGDGLLPDLGPDRAARWTPLASFRELGIPYVISSDSPVVDHHPRNGLRQRCAEPPPAARSWVRTRRWLSGTLCGPIR